MAAGLQKASHRWVLVVFCLLVIAAASPPLVDRVAEKIRFSIIPDKQRDQSSGLVRLVRELQFSLADLCYNKATLYQHRGIRFSVLKEDVLGDEIKEEHEQQAASEATTPGAALAGHEHHHEEGAVPWIPLADKDFRGIIGDVEREVKPYSPHHVHHVQPEEALPWLRLATLINPNHGKAWIGTAFTLRQKKGAGAAREAIAILERAMKYNPIQENVPYKQYEIPYMLGHIYIDDLKDWNGAARVLEPAIRRGEKDFVHLDEVQQDWLDYCFRDAVQAYRKSGRLEKAIEVCKRALVLYPDSAPLHKTLRRLKKQLEQSNAQPTTK